VKSAKTTELKPFVPRSDRTYIVFNKPYAVLAQFTQPEGSDKETLASFAFPKDVYPVGRLDYDSEGMLLLTDDTRLNQALLLPENAHERKYWVQVENVPNQSALNHLERGVVIEGKRTQPGRARVLSQEPTLPNRSRPIRFRASIPTAWVELILQEGRNRQVRKMTAAIGHPTLRLFRVQIGQLSLFDLGIAPGEWRSLNDQQVRKLFDKTTSQSC
jgi:23S rRNA pseudouridine2457 synthase